MLMAILILILFSLMIPWILKDRKQELSIGCLLSGHRTNLFLYICLFFLIAGFDKIMIFKEIKKLKQPVVNSKKILDVFECHFVHFKYYREAI